MINDKSTNDKSTKKLYNDKSTISLVSTCQSLFIHTPTIVGALFVCMSDAIGMLFTTCYHISQ